MWSLFSLPSSFFLQSTIADEDKIKSYAFCYGMIWEWITMLHTDKKIRCCGCELMYSSTSSTNNVHLHHDWGRYKREERQRRWITRSTWTKICEQMCAFWTLFWLASLLSWIEHLDYMNKETRNKMNEDELVPINGAVNEWHTNQNNKQSHSFSSLLSSRK